MNNDINNDYDQVKEMINKRNQQERLEQLTMISNNSPQAKDIITPTKFKVTAKKKEKSTSLAYKAAVIGIIVVVLGSFALIGSKIPEALEKEAAVNAAISKPYIEAIQERESLEEIEKLEKELNEKEYFDIVGNPAIEINQDVLEPENDGRSL